MSEQRSHGPLAGHERRAPSRCSPLAAEPGPAGGCGARRPVPVLGDRRLVARAGVALIVANARYWSAVARVVRGELRRWELRARAIHDRELRALALEKLRSEGFHAEAAAMHATLAPRAHRRHAVEAIVALELLFDYLDGRTEIPTADPLGSGGRLFEAYTGALAGLSERGGDGRREGSRAEDGGYLEALSDAVRAAFARLPAAGAIAPVARASAARSAQAQIRMHATPQLGAGQVEDWARGEAQGTGLQWRELLAGAASSVLAIHALIAAAADPRTTPGEAVEIESAYLCTCTSLTLLDGLIDHDEDTRAGTEGLGYIGLYQDPRCLYQALSGATGEAAARMGRLRSGPHHAMTLVGVVAYYTSAPGAGSELAAPIVERLHRQLAPLISPTLAIMRVWRLAKRARGWAGGDGPGGAARRRASMVFGNHAEGEVR
jgi:tetraprenyl-beta-curcumene synthase